VGLAQMSSLSSRKYGHNARVSSGA
jgi:hypothetical protein